MPDLQSRSVSTTRQELAITMCLLILAVLFCFQELVANPTHLLLGAHRGGENDLTAYFLRALEQPRRELEAGRFPSWNPSLSLGGPTWGNPQALLFYPPNWLCIWLGPVSISWMLVAHHWWAGLGCYFAARQMSVRAASAMIAGVIGAVAPYAIGHTAEGHYPQTCVMAWIPWAFWAFERFLATSGRRWLGVSLCLAMSFLAGHVQESFYLAVVLTMTVLCVVAGRQWSRSQEQAKGSAASSDTGVRLLLFWGLAGVMTIGLVLIELLPTFINSRLSVRTSGLPLALAGDGLKRQHVSQLWKPADWGAVVSDSQRFWEYTFHFGILASVLAVVGILVARREPIVRRLTWQLMATIGFAFGASSPLFRACYHWLPGVSSFRGPARILYLSSMIVAILAAIGWDRLWNVSRTQTASRAKLFAAATLVILGAITWELSRFTARVVAMMPMTSIRVDSPISQFLKARSPSGRVLSEFALYNDRETLRDGQQRVLGYEPFLLQRYTILLDALSVTGSMPDPGGFHIPSLQELRKPIADLAGIQYAITPSAQRNVRDWKRVASGEVSLSVALPGLRIPPLDYAIFENQTVMPRAFVVGRVTEANPPTRGVRPSEQLTRLNPRESVLLSRDAWRDDQQRCDFAAASLESTSPNEIRIRAKASGFGYLVLSDLYHPGWSATIDGTPVPVLPANIAFRAVAITPGEHEIVFRFSVPGATAGALISAFSWLAVIVFAGSLKLQKEFETTESPTKLANFSRTPVE